MESKYNKNMFDIISGIPAMIRKRVRTNKKDTENKIRIKIGGVLTEESTSTVDISTFIRENEKDSLNLKNYNVGDWGIIALLSSEPKSDLHNTFFGSNNISRLIRSVDNICLKESQKKRR